ncbi:MAG: T9SS type A sorting domain-containing protein [Bacteroidota bacterium]
MNQLFTRLLLLSVVLVGFVMPDLFAQPDGLDATNTDDEPCFAIWDTDDKRGKVISPFGRRYIDIFIPGDLNYTQYRSVVRFYDTNGNILALPGPGNNNGLVQNINLASLSANISTQTTPDGTIYTYELITPFAQSSVSSISFNLYYFHLNVWTSMQTGGASSWDLTNGSTRASCWTYRRKATKVTKMIGRLGQQNAIVNWAYPNPAEGILHIAPTEAASTLKLYDVSGSLLSSWQLPASDSQHKISIQAFPAGVYYLQRHIGAERQYQRIQVL